MGYSNWTSAWFTEALLGRVSFLRLPARFNESHRLKPQKPSGRGASYRWCRLSAIDVSAIMFSFYQFRQRVLECSGPYSQAAGHISHVQKRVQPEDFFDVVDLLFRHCLRPPSISFLRLEWMGLLESHKEILKGYLSWNFLCGIMAKFRQYSLPII